MKKLLFILLLMLSNPDFALAQVSVAGPYSSAARGQLPGSNTNATANAGNIGEVISSSVASGSAVSLTSNTAANVTSISLTAGTWDIDAQSVFSPAATTNVTQYFVSVSNASATLDAVTPFAQNIQDVPAGVPINISSFFAGPVRVNLSATTTYYIVVRSIFTVSTMGAYGAIRATRVY